MNRIPRPISFIWLSASSADKQGNSLVVTIPNEFHHRVTEHRDYTQPMHFLPNLAGFQPVRIESPTNTVLTT